MKFVEFILKKSKFIAPIIIIIALVHGFFGVHRWQYYPLYLLGVLYFVLILLDYLDIFNLNSKTSKWIISIIILLIILSIISILGFQKQDLPTPSGEFQIGTKIFELEDKSRDEVYTEEEGDKRKIKYQAWYPTDEIETLQKAKWITEGTLLTTNLGKNILLTPRFILNHTAEIDSNSYYDAKLSRSLDKYPIVVISHGWKGFREIHTDFAEDLASNGFVVLSIDHTYGSQAVKFNDGKVAYLKRSALPRLVKPSTFDKAAHELAVNFGKDVIMVLDEIERLNKEDETFMEKLDLDKIGLLGHSTGGAGDVFTSLKDKRVKALIGLDAWVNPLNIEDLKKGLEIPSLFLRSEQWTKRQSVEPLNVLVKNSDNANIIQLENTNHVDFTMVYMYSPLSKYVGFTGKEGGRESAKMQREITLKFFDENLRNNNNEDFLKEILEKYDNLKLKEIN